VCKIRLYLTKPFPFRFGRFELGYVYRNTDVFTDFSCPILMSYGK